MQNPPTVRIGGQVSKSLYQFSMQSPDHDAAVRDARASCEKALAERAGPRGPDERPRGHEPAGRTSTSTATRRRRSASPPTRSRTRSTTPTARAGSRRSTRRSTNTRCCSSWRRSSRPIRRAVAAVFQVAAPARATGRVGAARYAGAHRRQQDDRAADGQPLRPAARRHDLVRPRARRVARRRAEPRQRGRGRHAARRRHRPVPGRGQGVPELARQPRRAAPHRGHGRLHRARHPLRELHPSADDSLGPAVGRRSARWSR